MRRVFLVMVAALLGAVGLGAVTLGYVAMADYQARGCAAGPRGAHCDDARLSLRLYAGVGLVSLGAAWVLLRRARRHHA